MLSSNAAMPTACRRTSIPALRDQRRCKRLGRLCPDFRQTRNSDSVPSGTSLLDDPAILRTRASAPRLPKKKKKKPRERLDFSSAEYFSALRNDSLASLQARGVSRNSRAPSHFPALGFCFHMPPSLTNTLAKPH